MKVNVTLNNGVEMPALGFGVFQTPPETTAASATSGNTPAAEINVMSNDPGYLQLWRIMNANNGNATAATRA